MNTVANFRPTLYGQENEQYKVNPGTTILQWLIESGFDQRMREDPIVVMLNGLELMEAQYKTVLKGGDVLELQLLPRGAVFVQVAIWVYYAVVIIAAIQVLTMDEPGIPESADVKPGSPTYSISARGNRYRPGKGGPILYGTLRVVPDYDQPPFSTYDANNDQTLHMLFRVTQGLAQVDLTSITFEDTPISNFSGIQLEVIPPGSVPTLFPTGVVQSNDLNNLELTGGFTPAYVANDVGTKISTIAVDMSSAGLAVQDKKTGTLSTLTVNFRVWAQEFSDDGAPVGSWVLLGNAFLSGSSNDAIRRTFEFAVTPKRYQVRLERVTSKSTSQYVRDSITWAALKGFLHNPNDVSQNTRLAISVRASEQIGNRALTDMSVIASRRLPTWNSSTGWGTETLTNSIAWALADLCRNSYAGNRSDLNYDLQKLALLDAQLTPIGHEFNAYFDTDGVSVWDALSKAGTPGRITTIDRAGFYTFVRDEFQPATVQAFSMRNIGRGSFRIEHSGVLEETADSILLEFQDEDNDYRTRELLCSLPDSSASNPRTIKLFGITNATRAKELGMFMCAANRYRRKITPFETGVEGRIPFFGDKIALGHYLLGAEGAKQISGEITDYNGSDKIKISEEVRASQFTDPHIVIIDLEGKPSPAYPVTIINNQVLQVGGSPDWSQVLIEPGYKLPMFMLGDGSEHVTESKVLKIKKRGQVVDIEAFVDDPRVYTYGDGVIPPDPEVIQPPQPAAPVLTELKADLAGTITEPQVILSWSLKNSDRTDIQFSTDGGINFIPIGPGFTLENKFTHSPPVGVITYRLAAVNLFRGPWVSVTINTNDTAFAVPPNPTSLTLREAFTGPILKVQWVSDSYNHYIEVRVGGSTLYTTTVEGVQWDFSGDLAQQFAVGRSFTVRVYAVGANSKTSSGYAELAVTNPAPAQLDNLAINPLLGVASITFDWPAGTDIVGINVWKSNANGFIPGAANLNVDRSRDPVLKVPVGEAEVAYIRVAAVDNWGSSGLNISGQFTVTGKSVDTEAIQAELDLLAEDLANLEIDLGIAESDIAAAEAEISDLNSTLDSTNSTVSGLAGKFPVQAVDIGNDQITAPKILANSVTTEKLAALAVTAGKIAALAIEADKIAANAVTAEKIVALAVTTEKLAALAVTIDKLAVNSVSADKIVANAITADKIAALAITAAKIAANTITADKMNISQLSALTANMGTLTAGTLQTTPGTTPRVVISSSGVFPFWMGNGSVSEANGVLYFDTSGNATFKGKLSVKSASSGARLEIDNDVIRVYDEGGTLRVKLGRLT